MSVSSAQYYVVRTEHEADSTRGSASLMAVKHSQYQALFFLTCTSCYTMQLARWLKLTKRKKPIAWHQWEKLMYVKLTQQEQELVGTLSRLMITDTAVLPAPIAAACCLLLLGPSLSYNRHVGQI